MIAPDGRPATFNGQAWVSQDGKLWWNGATWQRIGGRSRPNLFVIGVGIAIVAAVGLVIAGVIRPAPAPTPAPVTMGVTNAKIDSLSRIEFDYARNSDCDQLGFDIVFNDKVGHKVDEYSGFVGHVFGGSTHHYRFELNHSLASTAVTFVATAVCR